MQNDSIFYSFENRKVDVDRAKNNVNITRNVILREIQSQINGTRLSLMTKALELAFLAREQLTPTSCSRFNFLIQHSITL